ncbi:MAG: hypothetical protein ABXS91_08735 [Sulfurimonas sp.]
MKDKNGTILKIGDKVKVDGVVGMLMNFNGKSCYERDGIRVPLNEIDTNSIVKVA